MKLILLFSFMLNFGIGAEAFPEKLKEIINFCEFMSGQKVVVPGLVPLELVSTDHFIINAIDEAKSNIPKYEFGKNGIVSEGGVINKQLIWSIKENVLYIDRNDNTPMVIIVNSKDGFRIFSGDWIDWPKIEVKKL